MLVEVPDWNAEPRGITLHLKHIGTALLACGRWRLPRLHMAGLAALPARLDLAHERSE